MDGSDIGSSRGNSDEAEKFSASEDSDESSEENAVEEPSHKKVPLISDSVHNVVRKDLCFEDLLKLRDRVGTKQFDRDVLSSRRTTGKGQNSNFKRKNKNHPREMSSKVKVSKLRQESASVAGLQQLYSNVIHCYTPLVQETPVVPVSKEHTTKRDPRFDDLCGSEYNEELFDKRFGFLDDIRKREMKQLTNKMKKSKNDAQRKQLRYLVNRFKQQDVAKKQRVENRTLEREWKKNEREKVKQGIKKPFFLKKSAKKKMLEEFKNEKLKKKGTLNKVEARRDKKKKAKESKTMPFSRRLATT